jgi:hypothetical protein
MMPRILALKASASPTSRRMSGTTMRSQLDQRRREGDDHPAQLFIRFLTGRDESTPWNAACSVGLPLPTRTMSGPIGISGFEERKFEGDRSTKEVATQVRVARADTVQLRA